jgi:hypothetical protein
MENEAKDGGFAMGWVEDRRKGAGRIRKNQISKEHRNSSSSRWEWKTGESGENRAGWEKLRCPVF